MLMNIKQIMEDLIRVLVLQNDGIRYAADYVSNVNTLSIYNQILDYKVNCERMLSMIAYNMYPFLTYNQRQQLLKFFHHQKEECNKALLRLTQDSLCDKALSKLAERMSSGISRR